ncbi:MAG: glycosyltransferase [Sodaliphilus sp.]
MTYRISVLMGIYNCGSTLQEALDSLYAQTFQDFKIILCDDGSKDNTLEIAEQNARLHPNVVVIKNEKNLKLAATLNHCLEYVDTEYVARMDGDDICDPTRFAKELSFLESHPEYALVSCPMFHFDANGIWKVGIIKEKEPTFKSFSYGTPFCHAPVMMRTDALRSIGGYTAEPWVERIEDYYLWYKFYKAGYKGYNLSEPLYSMRDDKNAISRRKVRDRIRTYKLGVKVKKSLGSPRPYTSGLKGLMKIFVPSFIVRFLRK